MTIRDTQAAAGNHLVGGVISAWNHFQVSGRLVVSHAESCYIWDTAGRKRIDWIMGWGSLVLGHQPQAVIESMQYAVERGFGFMYETPRNAELTDKIAEMVPSAEKTRLANSGSEATLHAVRIARAATERKLIVKFEGHFHGLNDYLMYGVDASPKFGEISRSGVIVPVPGSKGLPDAELGGLLRILPFNDPDAVERLFEEEGRDIAGIILEPIALNIGCVPPVDGFLELLREICDRYGSLLIFDEVLTGFRLGEGGAQAMFGVRPDLTCLGKALGCGMPAAAVCGKKDYMDLLQPVGPVEMAGTNTGRHLTVCGIIGALNGMQKVSAWSSLRTLNDRFVAGARDLFSRYGVPAHVEGFGGRIGVHIGSETRPRDFREVCATWNSTYYRQCYWKAHNEKDLFGFLLPLGICPEPVTLSVAHNEKVIDETLSRLESILSELPYKKGG